MNFSDRVRGWPLGPMVPLLAFGFWVLIGAAWPGYTGSTAHDPSSIPTETMLELVTAALLAGVAFALSVLGVIYRHGFLRRTAFCIGGFGAFDAFSIALAMLNATPLSTY